MSNVMQSLGEYVNKVLDVNGDGKTNIKDIIDLFPNAAVMIAIMFVDFVVAIAEYRVFDVGMKITNDPWKAIGFVAISAIPFYLGQIFWLYPVANGVQKGIAVTMVAMALYTSWVFGTADLSQNFNVGQIIQMVTNLTAGYIITVLGYILFDDGIKANRIKKQTSGAAKREKEYQKIVREVLSELAITQRLQRETEMEFGDPELVRSQLDRLRGTKAKQQAQPTIQPMLALGSETEQVQLAPKDKGQSGQQPPK